MQKISIYFDNNFIIINNLQLIINYIFINNDNNI